MHPYNKNDRIFRTLTNGYFFTILPSNSRLGQIKLSYFPIHCSFMIHFIIVSPSTIAVAQWLRCCATNGKVAGSIPDGVIGIFH